MMMMRSKKMRQVEGETGKNGLSEEWMIKCTTIALFLHRTVRTDNLARLSVRTVRCKNSAMVVHFISGRVGEERETLVCIREKGGFY